MMPSRMSFIKLELAREIAEQAELASHAYELHLPLSDDGRIDVSEWRRDPMRCHVTRKRPGEPSASSRILFFNGGTWALDFPNQNSRDDEVGFRLSSDMFLEGEYVSIREDDGRMHLFRIMQVRSL